MYEEVAQDGKRRYTVQQIADEFGVAQAGPEPAPPPPPEYGFTRDALLRPPRRTH